METSNSVLTIIGDFSQDSKNCENESCITPASILSPQISLLDEENPSNSAQNFSQFKEQTSFSDCNSDIILSVYWKRGKLGAAYYTGTDAEVRNCKWKLVKTIKVVKIVRYRRPRKE